MLLIIFFAIDFLITPDVIAMMPRFAFSLRLLLIRRLLRHAIYAFR